MTEHIKQQIEDKYDLLTNEDNDIAIREYNQRHYDQRSAASWCYSLAEQEITRLKELLKNSFQLTARKLYFSQKQVDDEWQQFKTDNNL